MVEAKYDFANTFNEGFATVKLNGKATFINKKGNQIIAPIYDEIAEFDNGLAVVSNNKKYGIINSQGREIIKVESDNNLASLVEFISNSK
jgi:hypothetical protein